MKALNNTSLKSKTLVPSFIKYSYFQLKTSSQKIIRSNFKEIDKNDITYFEGVLGSNNILQDDLLHYNKDWFGHFTGNSKLVLKPKTTEQYSENS